MDTSAHSAAPPTPSTAAGGSEAGRSPRRPVSFTIGTAGAHPPAPSADSVRPSTAPPPIAVGGGLKEGADSHLPLLPRRKRPTFSRHRHDANPALAVKVLQDIQMAVEAWHRDLRQTVQNIQALYLEGPMVDGWLETIDQSPLATPGADMDAALLRHGDPQALSRYVEHLCQAADAPDSAAPPSSTELARPGYRLCSLDSDGRVQYYPCPPEQLSTLSLAIARHQKLRQLLDHKQFLEAKLKRTVEVMTSSRDTLGIAPTCSSAPEEE